MAITILDLNHDCPRSPRERLGGMVHLGRIIDKARAKAVGLLGEYLYPCPLDERLLGFFDLKAEAFSKAVSKATDDEIARWIREAGLKRSDDEIETWNHAFLKQEAEDEEGKRRFFRKRDRIAPTREDVVAWVDLLDLDEGRHVPIRASS